MGFDLFLVICNYIGTIAFAISGVMKGVKKQLDILGIIILATVTAVGGGMIRDVLVQRFPDALLHPGPLYVSALVAICLYIPLRKKEASRVLTKKRWGIFLSQTTKVFDAIGLVIFALIGASTSVQLGLNAVTSGILAALTGAGGGLLRDLFVNETPSMLKEDIYAILAFLAGIAYHVALVQFGWHRIPTFLTLFVIVLIIRFVVIYYHLNLPGGAREVRKNEGF